MSRRAPEREAIAVASRPAPADNVLLAVVAAHRTGQPLHPELVALGARFERRTRTAPMYRLIALPGAGVPRGGIVVAPVGGSCVEVELHRLPISAIGLLVSLLPASLAVGAVALVDGSSLGIVCVGAPNGARDVTVHGSWPAYLASGQARPVGVLQQESSSTGRG